MADDGRITRERVVELALAGRVAADPAFHARSAHNVKFQTLAQQLLFTFRVERHRDPGLLHAFRCWTQNWGKEVYCIDFNLETNADGEIILIVTGWKLEEREA